MSRCLQGARDPGLGAGLGAPLAMCAERRREAFADVRLSSAPALHPRAGTQGAAGDLEKPASKV